MIRRPACQSLLTVLVALPVVVACQTTGPSLAADVREGPADTVLTLAAGQEVHAPDGVMRIAFLGVRSDSRCPMDVQCVWAGNAEVQIGVAFGTGPTVAYLLNTGLGVRSVDVGASRLTLVDLRPAPVSTSRIPPDRYVASLRLQRLVQPGPAPRP
jgi:hypothetical protein